MSTVSTSNLKDTKRLDSQSYQPGFDTACLAIAWVKGIESKIQEKMILDLLSGVGGVNQAMFSRYKPDLLIIDYDRQQIKASDLLEKMNQLHVQAKLVGC